MRKLFRNFLMLVPFALGMISCVDNSDNPVADTPTVVSRCLASSKRRTYTQIAISMSSKVPQLHAGDAEYL